MKLEKREVILLVLWLSFMLLMSCGKSSTPTTPSTPFDPTKPVIKEFYALPYEILLERSATLYWTVSNAEKVEIDHGIGTVPLTGETSASPTETTVYTLTATKGDLTVRSTTELVVEWKPFDVYITDTGTTFHRDGCQYLSQSKIRTTLGDACQKGYSACPVCKPPVCR